MKNIFQRIIVLLLVPTLALGFAGPMDMTGEHGGLSVQSHESLNNQAVETPLDGAQFHPPGIDRAEQFGVIRGAKQAKTRTKRVGLSQLSDPALYQPAVKGTLTARHLLSLNSSLSRTKVLYYLRILHYAGVFDLSHPDNRLEAFDRPYQLGRPFRGLPPGREPRGLAIPEIGAAACSGNLDVKFWSAMVKDDQIHAAEILQILKAFGILKSTELRRYGLTEPFAEHLIQALLQTTSSTSSPSPHSKKLWRQLDDTTIVDSAGDSLTLGNIRLLNGFPYTITSVTVDPHGQPHAWATAAQGMVTSELSADEIRRSQAVPHPPKPMGLEWDSEPGRRAREVSQAMENAEAAGDDALAKRLRLELKKIAFSAASSETDFSMPLRRGVIAALKSLHPSELFWKLLKDVYRDRTTKDRAKKIALLKSVFPETYEDFYDRIPARFQERSWNIVGPRHARWVLFDGHFISSTLTHMDERRILQEQMASEYFRRFYKTVHSILYKRRPWHKLPPRRAALKAAIRVHTRWVIENFDDRQMQTDRRFFYRVATAGA